MMFNREVHSERLVEFYKSQGMDVDLDLLPTIGFINDHAACFLITTNSDYVCFIEFLIARRGFHSNSVDQVVNECLNYAKDAGYKQVYALTSSIRTIKRAKKLHGFSLCDQKVLLSRGL